MEICKPDSKELEICKSDVENNIKEERRGKRNGHSQDFNNETEKVIVKAHVVLGRWQIAIHIMVLSAVTEGKTYVLIFAMTAEASIFFFFFFSTKTHLYSFDPLQPHSYIVKLGFRGVYINLISAQNIDYGYLLEPPHRVGSNNYPQSMF